MIFNSNNKELTLVPIGGLGNRMLAITSSINYCLRKDFNLKILLEIREWALIFMIYLIYQILLIM